MQTHPVTVREVRDNDFLVSLDDSTHPPALDQGVWVSRNGFGYNGKVAVGDIGSIRWESRGSYAVWKFLPQ